ncbi:sodium:proton antiporter, partial [Sesbania bispinosa]
MAVLLPLTSIPDPHISPTSVRSYSKPSLLEQPVAAMDTVGSHYRWRWAPSPLSPEASPFLVIAALQLPCYA